MRKGVPPDDSVLSCSDAIFELHPVQMNVKLGHKPPYLLKYFS